MEMMSKKKKPFEIPEQFLRQIDEMSLGGFVLFTFDESGLPAVSSCFDDPIHSIAMSSFIKHWANAVDNAHQMMTQHMVLQPPPKKK